MALNLDLIIIFSLILGVIGIFTGILLTGKVTGKFKNTIIFLVITELIFTIGLVINILNVLQRISLRNLVFWDNIINLGVSLFLLFTFFSLLSMIKDVRNQ